ncbi:MAG: hypothetical protein HKL96_05450 [Phycisphaerales bacterium]|nr:hypothetical protein [Phycisphaerales bacterium]
MKLYSISLGLLAAASLVATAAANTTAVLQVQTSAGSSLTVNDNGIGDAENTSVGNISITYPTTVGDYTIGTADSSGKPSNQATLQNHVLALDNTGTSTETISILFSDLGFTPGLGQSVQQTLFSSASLNYISGSGTATARFQSYIDPGNAPITLASLPANATPLLSASVAAGTGTINLTDSGGHTSTSTQFYLGGPFSMADLVRLSLPAGGQLNFAGSTEATVQVVAPEPAEFTCLAVLGTVLLTPRLRKANRSGKPAIKW